MAVFQGVICRLHGFAYAANYRPCLINRICSTAFQYTPKISVEEKLGIRPRPKRPLTPYLKFLAHHRASIVQQHPKAHPKVILKLLSEEWNKVDEKLKSQWQEEYKQEWLQYTEDCKEYDKLLTPVDREEIEKAKLDAKTAKEKKQLKKQKEDLGCPKRPGSSYVYFMKSKLSERGDASLGEFQKKLKEEWDKLPELQKDRFEQLYKKDMEDYRIKMSLWMKKMEQEGIQIPGKKDKTDGPKKPPSSYFYFFKTKLHERGEIPFKEYQRKVRDEWGKLPPNEKKIYEDLYKKDLEAFKLKLADWKSHQEAKDQGVRR